MENRVGGEGWTDTLKDTAPPPLAGRWTQALRLPHLFLMIIL